MDSFVSCWWVSGSSQRKPSATFRTKTPLREIGEGPVLVDVCYSSLNYKDALALRKRPGILRRLPLVPGIDAAGVVLKSESEKIPEGSRVVINGNGYGESRHGGFSSKMFVETNHVIQIPESLTLKDAACLGTAGVTAALAIDALRSRGPDLGISTLPIAVTGASGGVGSLAVSMLSALGFATVAITGSPKEAKFLKSLGATEVISNKEFLEPAQKALLPERFSGAIDQVGGHILANLIASTAAGGVVASCGLALSPKLTTSVMPLILRGVTLKGINSVSVPQTTRAQIWDNFSQAVSRLKLEKISRSVDFQSLDTYAEQMLSGNTRGRLIIKLPH